MKRLLLALAALLLLLIVALPAATWWLIGTEPGNGVLLDRVAPLIGAQLRIGERRGDIADALEWRDIEYDDAHAHVTIARLVLKWQPLRLWERLLAIGELRADGLHVALKPRQDPPPPSNSPPPSRLPVNIEIGLLALTDFQFTAAGATQPLRVTRAEFVGRWIGSRVAIKRFEADYPGVGAVSLQADARLGSRGVDIRKLSVLAPVLVTAQGFVAYDQADSDLQAAWRELRWPMPGVLGAAPDALPIVTSSEGQLTLKGPWRDLRFTLSAALGDQGRIQADGGWNGALDAKARWTGLSWPLVAAPGPDGKPLPPLVQSASGSVAVQGTPEAYRFDVAADVAAQQQAGRVDVRGAGTPRSVDLKALKIALGQGLIEAAGPVTWAPQPGGALKGRIVRLDPALVAAAWPGDLNGDFSIDGVLAEGQAPALHFVLKLAESRLRNYPFKLDLEGRYADTALDIDRLDLASGSSTLQLSGRASAPYDLQAQLSSPQLNELAPGLGGSAQAKARFRGQLDAPQLVADATLTRASVGSTTLASLKLSADLDWNGALKLDLTARDLIAGLHLQTLSLQGSGRRGAHELTLAMTSRELNADLKLDGGWNDAAAQWQGRIAASQIKPVRLPGWALQPGAPLSLSAAQADLGPACWTSDPGRVCLEAHRSPDAARGSVQIEQLAFEAFKALLPPDMQIDGELNGRASAELNAGVLRQASAELSTTAGQIQLGDRRFKFLPGSLTVSDAPDQGRAALRLPLEVGGIEGEATLAPGPVLADRVLAGQLRIDFPDIAFISALTNEVSSATGKLAGQYRIGGRVAAPEFEGEARLTDGRMKLTRPGIELTDLTATVSGSPDGRVQLLAQARSGGGTLSVDGRVETGPLAVEPVSGSPAPNQRRRAKPEDPIADLGAAVRAPQAVAPVQAPDAPAGNANTPQQNAVGVAASPSTQPPPPEVLPTENTEGLKLVVQVDGDNFQIANLPMAQVWASPNLRFTLSGPEASLKGRLTIPRADVRLQQGEDSGVGPSSDQVIVDASGQVPQRSESFSLATEVKLVLGDRVKIEGFGLKTRIEGVATAVDQPGRETVGYGEFRLVEGRYKAYGQDLQIETGKLLLNGGPISKPGLEIRAVRKPTEDVSVGIYVRGTLEKPVLTLYSEPTMTQQQQLSWLLLGRPLEQSSSSQDRSALSGAAMALGLGGGSFLAQGLQKGLGLDSISLGSDPGESNEQARLTVGKYLSPKIFVSYGIGLFQPGNVFKLLYDLGKGFKLSTESGTFTGGDLLYQVERR